MCLCNFYLQTVTAAVDVNLSEQFMEVLNKELFSLASVQKKENFLMQWAEFWCKGY